MFKNECSQTFRFEFSSLIRSQIIVLSYRKLMFYFLSKEFDWVMFKLRVLWILFAELSKEYGVSFDLPWYTTYIYTQWAAIFQFYICFSQTILEALTLAIVITITRIIGSVYVKCIFDSIYKCQIEVCVTC